MLDIQLDKDGTTFLARHVNGKFLQQSDAQVIIAAIASESHALAEKS